MKTFLRLVAGILFFLLAAFGALTGIVYPWVAANQTGYELARWQALSESGGLRSFETILPSSEEMIVVRVEIETPAATEELDWRPVLELTVSRADFVQFAQSLGLEGAQRVDGPADGGRYVLTAGALHYIDDEPFSFVFETTGSAIPLTSVELVLVGGTYEMDESVPPIGLGVMAVGVVGFVLVVRRRRPAQTPPPRWGRG